MRTAHKSSLTDKATLAITSVAGLGYMPVAPGTFGSLAALPICYWQSNHGLVATLGLVMVATVFAIGVSHQAEAIYKGHDVQHIVIDEVVGMMWSCVLVPWRWQQMVVAFVLFRLFDALKPWPIGAIDRRVQGGLGVVLDDVAAGMVTCCVLHAARFFCRGWW